MMKSQSFKWSLLLALFFWTQMSIAQQIPIQGAVVSDTDKLPIIGASVIEKGTTNGTITDLDGNFSLNVTPGSIILNSYFTVEKTRREHLREAKFTKNRDEYFPIPKQQINFSKKLYVQNYGW
jgi:hypothetical protein